MSDNVNNREQLVLTRLLRLDAKIQGLIAGLLAGLAVLISTNWLIIDGETQAGSQLVLLGQFFIGYEVTFIGSLIGFAYAFVVGFLIGFGVTALYNWIVELREHTGLSHPSR